MKKYIKREWISPSNATEKEIIEFLKEHKNVIIKPRTDYGGFGFKKLKNISPEKFNYDSINIFANENIIEECIENNTQIKEIAPSSLNTIRVVTFLDKSKSVQILAALLRFGDGMSHTDNYTTGGLACPIDLKTGCLSGKAQGINCMEYTIHPFSKIKFDGLKIENIEKCFQLAKELALVVPEARFVGWDLAITPKGIDLLEGNIPPGENILQMATKRGMYYEIKEMI